jgi:hypothetical protein
LETTTAGAKIAMSTTTAAAKSTRAAMREMSG